MAGVRTLEKSEHGQPAVENCQDTVAARGEPSEACTDVEMVAV
jgi:hypothetical protein